MKHTISTVSKLVSKLLIVPLITLLAPMANATELQMQKRHLPLYIDFATSLEGDDLHAKPSPVIMLTRHTDPEFTIAFLNSPYMPQHDESTLQKTDANLISMCGVKISYEQIKSEKNPGKFAMEIRIDASAFKKPEDIDMTDEEVMKLIRQTVALNFPKTKIITLPAKP